MPLPQVRVFTLNANENSESKLYRLEKGWTLRFVLGPSLMAANVRLFCNHPPNQETAFKRSHYSEVEWKNSTGIKGDRTDLMVEIKMVIAGSFNFFFTTDSSEDPSHSNGSGYFLVDPTLHIGPNEDEIGLDAITCQTVITKLLGPFQEWMPRLQVSVESGYNMVHFTPIQELGISNSAYSIRDQLRLSPVYSPGNETYTLDDVQTLVRQLNHKHGLMSMSDLVYNHTAKDSPWVWEHPECTFNLDNSPHLRPAYVVDRIFENFSLEVSKGLWQPEGIPVSVNSEDHLRVIEHIIRHKVFPSYRIHEFYTVSVDTTLKEFKRLIDSNSNGVISDVKGDKLTIIQDPQYRRFKSTVDINLVLKLFNTDRPGVYSRSDRINKCCEALVGELVSLNAGKEREILDHVNVAISNFIANVRWRFVNPDGPKLTEVTPDEPLMFGYFIIPKSHEGGVEKEEKLSLDEGSKVMAVNGWVMGDDPLSNFAEPGRNVYLRRELVAWGDSVKLNYGKSPKDCPYLWDRMEEYTRQSARIFQGLRLDNCHSTPIHVAAHMLDVARSIRPDLYVIAELFTGSEYLDNLFMNHLGVNSLVRESLTAWNSHEQGRLVHRFGGQPVGAFIQPRVQPLVPCLAHALFYDQTHDNESPIDKRSAYDSWPMAAMVAITNCATGSNRGFDQMVPHHINVVKEERLYPSWHSADNPGMQFINGKFGMTAGKKALNTLHAMLAEQGFSQVYVDQLDPDTVSVTRHNPQTHNSVVLVARTAFGHPANPNDTGGHIRSIQIEGTVTEMILEGRMRATEMFTYKKDSSFINGLPNYYLDLKEKFPASQSGVINVKVLEGGAKSEISFKNLTPGCVLAVRCSFTDDVKKAILEIRRGLGQFGYMMRSYSGNTMFNEAEHESNFRVIVSKLTLADLNRCLYRIDQEEKDDGYGFGAYNIPNHGNLPYCGLRGIISLMSHIRPSNDLGHPLCTNLREGDWLADYTANRLKPHVGTEQLGVWFSNIFSFLKLVPRFLVPCYFDAIVTGAYMVLMETATNLMADFVKDGSTFVKALSMTSLQVVGYSCQARLPFLSPKLLPPPREEFNKHTNKLEQAPLSMSAGFPHFGNGYMRNWGRDTFIAVRGLLIVTGRHREARDIILAYAGTLRHGLIPNLLNEGRLARFNCRDSVWYWLQAIQEYCSTVPDGYAILNLPVSRMYPSDEAKAQDPGVVDQPLHQVMQEALSRHAAGVKFRERNAGPQIDEHMTDNGFNNEIGVDWSTGFVSGGNEWNCGTWMDKMGSSVKAENRGKPATPRDGSAVELVGLCASTVKWLSEASGKGVYPFSGVEVVIQGHKTKITYKEWYDKIEANFEKSFFIPTTADTPNEPDAKLVSQRGIYKDSFKATQTWPDFQFRCNFPVAMVVAPSLFTPEKAWVALETMGNTLLGPLGMKTLTPKDWKYRGDYHNDNDSDDMAIAKGWNYHQGPEWVWPVGYFLRAKLFFAGRLEESRPGILEKTKLFANSVLCKHYEEILNSPWQGLPELTNSNGQYCAGSCRTQAWSNATILEVMYDLAKLEE